MKTMIDMSGHGFSRRRFLANTSALGAASFLGFPLSAVAEPPPETRKLKLVQIPNICQAPQYIAEELLKSEGFEVQYVQKQGGKGIESALASGEADVNMHYAAPILIRLDAGDPIVTLAGGHIGCFELVGSQRVRAIRDLKGKTVNIVELGDATHVYLASIAAYVGLDTQKDITWVTHPTAEAVELLAQGKIDGFLGIPPEPQELRARKIGRLLVDSAVDRPWSQYFCCLAYTNRDFARQHPVATKRALRAILKAADLCAADPAGAARTVVAKGYTPSYDYASAMLKGLPYNGWRTQNHEDSIRFYALRLHEAGMVKSSPQKLLAQGTDWRFLNELKKELKG